MAITVRSTSLPADVDSALNRDMFEVIQQVTPQVEKRKQLTRTAWHYCGFFFERATVSEAGREDRFYLTFKIESFVARLADGQLVQTNEPIIWQWNTIPCEGDDLERDIRFLKDVVADPYTWTKAKMPRGYFASGYSETRNEALYFKHVTSNDRSPAGIQADEFFLQHAVKARADHAKYLANWTEEALDWIEGPDCLGVPLDIESSIYISRDGDGEPIYLEEYEFSC